MEAEKQGSSPLCLTNVYANKRIFEFRKAPLNMWHCLSVLLSVDIIVIKQRCCTCQQFFTFSEVLKVFCFVRELTLFVQALHFFLKSAQDLTTCLCQLFFATELQIAETERQ